MTHAPPTNSTTATTSAAATKPRGMRDERRERADGRRLDGVIGAGDDDAPAGVGVVAAIELARGQNPGQGRGHGDCPAEKHERMRKTE